jgi:hypothetical protein
MTAATSEKAIPGEKMMVLVRVKKLKLGLTL